MTRITTIILAAIIAACSGPQAAERIESGDDIEPRHPPETAPRFEARPDVESLFDDAVDAIKSDGDYALLISQNGRYAPVSNYTVDLEPKPFTIWIVAPKGTGALVNVSYRPAARNAFIRGQELPGALGEPATGMAEKPFNQERLIQLHDEMSNYWVYSDENQHRFDEIEWRDDVYIGQRTIHHFRDPERDETHSVTDFAGNAVYVVEFQHRPLETSPPKRAYTIEF